MSDSEGSIVSMHGSEKSATREIVETMPNHNEDKLEEFQDFQSMLVSRSTSEEEEQLEEEDNASEEKIIGRLFTFIDFQHYQNTLSVFLIK